MKKAKKRGHDTRHIAGQNGFGRFGLNALKSWIDDRGAPYAIRYINDEVLTARDMFRIITSDPLVSFKKYKVTLNGNIIVDANLDDVKDEETLKKHPGLARTKGHIGFLGHGARVEFRNLRIKEL